MAMANALAGETSPYLLQHQDNPVDWQPWGEPALARARELDRPLLVSIGYSACHWCHVMERESFEDDEIAALMNEHFVCVKVDREERPDVDAIYMEAVQAMTGSGGWPLNVFITPEQVPFYARHVLPARAAPWDAELAGRCCGAVAEAWATQRDEIRAQNAAMAARLRGRRTAAARRGAARRARSSTTPSPSCARSTTRVNGGWGGAPKFPAASTIEFLLRRGETTMTPLHAALDGLRRHLRPGRRRLRALRDRQHAGRSRTSRRCSTTTRCSPARTCTAGRSAAGDEPRSDPAPHGRGDARLGAARDDAARRARSTARSTPTPRASRASSTSGALDELRSVLGDDADAAIAWFGASERGNFEGANILESRGPEPEPEVRERIRAALLAARAERVRPGPRRQAPDRLERAHDQRAGRGRRGARARRLPRRRAPRRRLRARRDARRRRPPAAHVQRRRGEAQRLPRGPRVPARGAADALRGDVRAALVPTPRASSPTP